MQLHRHPRDLAWLIGPDGVLDPTVWFILVADMFSNSVSTSAADHADFPPLVQRAVIVCGSARTSVHNPVFLPGLLRILEAAPEHLGTPSRQPQRQPLRLERGQDAD